MSRTYSSKVLLFGEYTIIDGSSALAIPFDRFSGHWKNDVNSDQSSLVRLRNYLVEQKIEAFDSHKMDEDLAKGIVFQSNIPMGYGVGSSGAVVAGVFDRYFHTEEYTLVELKGILSQIECCFHGKSSGIDPLVSYVNRSILSHANGQLTSVETNREVLKNIRLLDTGISRDTAPLVQLYKRHQQQGSFKKATQELTTLTNQLITSYLDNSKAFSQLFRQISELQLATLPFLIPKKFQTLWEKGLESEAFYLKLCGAGGGGFYLCYVNTKDAFNSLYIDSLSIV